MIGKVSENNLAILLILTAALSYGLYPSLTKLAYQQGATVATVVILSTVVRAAVLRMALLYLQRERRRRLLSFDRATVIASVMQVASIFGMLFSVKFISPAVMITLVFTHTSMILLYNTATGQISPSIMQLCTTLTALLGVSCIVNVFNGFEDVAIFGVLLALTAAIATAIRFLLFEKLAQEDVSLAIGFRVMLLASMLSLPLCLYEPFTFDGFFLILLSGLALGLGTVLTFYALSLVSALKISLFLKVEPIFTAIYAFFILGNALHAVQYVGMLLVLGSLYANEYFERRA